MRDILAVGLVTFFAIPVGYALGDTFGLWALPLCVVPATLMGIGAYEAARLVTR